MALSEKDLAARRHAEVVESLWRINVGLEALHQQGERQLKAFEALTARLEAALKYSIDAWQAVRGAAKS